MSGDRILVRELDGNFVVRSRRHVLLGPMRVDIRSNETTFSGMRYFPLYHDSEADAPADDYVLNFVNLNVDAPWPVLDLLAREKSQSGKRF